MGRDPRREALKVTWSRGDAAVPARHNLYDHIRNASRCASATRQRQHGDVDAAFAGAAKVVEAEYEWPFQSHASMGPACAVADVRADGVTRCGPARRSRITRATASRRCSASGRESARDLGAPGPGSYGRNDAGDAAMDAAVLSQAVGPPVRVQGMRDEGHGWDPKARPRSIARAPRSTRTARWSPRISGRKGFSRVDIDSNESDPGDTLAGQLLGAR